MNSDPKSPDRRQVHVTEEGLVHTLPEPDVPQSGPGHWVLVTRRGFGRDLTTQRREMSDDQARVIGRILTNLQRRLGCAPEMDLPLDERARDQFKTCAAESGARNIRYAQLVKEPLPGLIRRQAWVVPILLILLLVLAVLLLFVAPQGVDLLLQAEEGLGSAALVGLSLLLLPSALLAALAHNLTQQDSPAKSEGLWTAVFLSGCLGIGVSLLINALSIDPFGLLFFPMIIGFGILGPLLCLACRSAMEHPRMTVPAALVMLVVIGIWPAAIGDALGSPLTLAIILTAWAFLLSALVHWYRRAPGGPTYWVRRPQAQRPFGLSREPTTKLFGTVLALLIVAMIAKAFLLDSPADMMRGKPSSYTGPNLDQAYAEVIARQEKKGVVPVVVIVAAAGGGIKASYWTSKLLGRATDRAPQLADDLLAASGVSGGSLGLALYRALLQVKSPRCEGATISGALERCAKAFHRYDLLAGVIGAAGTTEIVNAFLPVFPRRSVALEKSLEARWRDTVRATNDAAAPGLFSQPFRDLWPKGGRATPALILNTTRTLIGDRIVASNLNLSGILSPPSTCDANIAEQIDLPLSTAANASARFPLVEPWGWFPVAKSIPGCNDQEAIADGGFYDNYGAATALDVYRRVKALAKDTKPAPRIIVIQISSDVDCRMAIALDRDTGRATDCENRRKARAQELAFRKPRGDFISRDRLETINFNANGPFRRFFYSDPTKPPKPPGVLGTALNAVSVTGLAVASRLRDTVVAGKDAYFHFSLGGALDIPLGWSLSRHARNEIDAQIDPGENENARELDRLVQALAEQPIQGKNAANPSRGRER
jgi:hypothetical protein